jgi:hypothetical protein
MSEPTELLFFAEVRSPRSTRRSVAVCYALLIARESARGTVGRNSELWPRIHAAICERFDITILKVDPIKKAAWEIYTAAALLQADGALSRHDEGAAKPNGPSQKDATQ